MSTVKKQITLDTVENRSPAIRRVYARASRAKVTALNHIELTLAVGKKKVSVKLINISTSGIGFELPKMVALPNHGSKITGELTFKDSKKSYDLELFIHQVEGRRLGCSFVNPTGMLIVSIAHYFDVELSALEVVKIKTQPQTSAKTQTQLFKGRDNCGLQFTHNAQGVIQSFKLMVFGNVMEWEKGKATAIVLTEGRNDKELMRLFMKFIINIPLLDEKFSDQLIELVHTKN